MYYHFQKDKKAAFSVLTLFFITGLAIIVYLNQDNPQPRERDYSYVGSFLAFSIWVGVAASALTEQVGKFIKEKQLGTRLAGAAIVAQVILIPGVMLFANYHSHNRTGKCPAPVAPIEVKLHLALHDRNMFLLWSLVQRIGIFSLTYFPIKYRYLQVRTHQNSKTYPT